VGRLFSEAVVEQPREAELVSDDHFTVDGTLIKASSLKYFRPKGEQGSGNNYQGNGRRRWVAFHDENRSNGTHDSSTDPDSCLMHKGGKEAELRYRAHALMINRNELSVDLEISQATGSVKRKAVDRPLKCQRRKGLKGKSLGADRGYAPMTLSICCAVEALSLAWRTIPN
jgi:hypothetical protein